MEDDLRIIDQYLNDEMTPEQRVLFEDRLAKEEQLKMHFAMVRDMEGALDPETAEFISVVQSISDETEETTPVIEMKRSSGFRYMGIAASILLVAAAYFLLRTDVPDPDMIYASNFEVYPSTNAVRGQGQQEGPFEKALGFYDKGEYDNAIIAFDESLQMETSEDASFYQAVSMMALGRSEEAIGIFDKLIFDQSKYVDVSKWYAALVHLQMGDIDRSKQMLTSLISTTDDTFYKKRASKLLGELNDL